MTLLSVRGLTAGYGRAEVLHGVSLTVRAGQIVAIVGPNGAGKTTLMLALMGLLPRSGEVLFLGRPAGATGDMVRQGAVLVPETRALFADMTIEDNLSLGAYARWRAGDRDLAASMDGVFGIFPRLRERRRQVAGTLSGGERQMLALGRALMGKPSLLLLDEPSLGLAPRVGAEIFRVIGELRARGIAVLLVEQNARAALRLADYGYVLETGRVVLEGDSDALSADQRVVETYLGRRAGA